MKRGTRPFIVEVRRGQKRALPINGEEESNALRNEALRRAEAALFGSLPAQPQTAKPEPAPAPEPRRILASLAEAEPLAALVAEPEPARRRGRKPGKAQKRIEPGRHGKRRLADKTAARSVPLTPELVNAALDEIEKATLAVPRRRPAAGPSSLSQRHPAAAGGGVEKALRVRRKKPATASHYAESKTKREPAKAAAPARPPRSSEKVERTVQRLPQPAPADKSRAPRPSIRGRYVFGTELKPGERWKRRLRRGR
jgi:hypothetical protein